MSKHMIIPLMHSSMIFNFILGWGTNNCNKTKMERQKKKKNEGQGKLQIAYMHCTTI